MPPFAKVRRQTCKSLRASCLALRWGGTHASSDGDGSSLRSIALPVAMVPRSFPLVLLPACSPADAVHCSRRHAAVCLGARHGGRAAAVGRQTWGAICSLFILYFMDCHGELHVCWCGILSCRAGWMVAACALHSEAACECGDQTRALFPRAPASWLRTARLVSGFKACGRFLCCARASKTRWVRGRGEQQRVVQLATPRWVATRQRSEAGALHARLTAQPCCSWCRATWSARGRRRLW